MFNYYVALSQIDLNPLLSRYRISESQTCEQDHALCTDHVVRYTLDHARLAVSTLDTRTFHTHQGMIGNTNLPLLVAFVHPENITTDSPLSQVRLRSGVVKPYISKKISSALILAIIATQSYF